MHLEATEFDPYFPNDFFLIGIVFPNLSSKFWSKDIMVLPMLSSS